MSTPSPQPSASTPMQVGPHKLSVVGVVAISRTMTCTRYAKDADRTPRMMARADPLRMSAQEVASLDRVVELAVTHSISALGAAERSIDALGDLDERLRPPDRAERLLKTYIIFGLLIDLGVALSESLKGLSRRGFVHELSQDPISTYATAELEEAIATDPQLAARLGPWGWCIIGEEVGAFQRLLGQFPELFGQMVQERLHSVLVQEVVSCVRGLGLRV